MLESSIAEIGIAFRHGGLEEADWATETLRLRNARFRVASTALEHVLPLRHISNELLWYGQLIGKKGLGRASREALERWRLFPRVDLAPATWSVLRTGPFLAFGNHPLGVESLFFGSLLEREDVYFLAGSHVSKASPGFSRHVIEIANATNRSGRRPLSGIRGRISHAVETQIWPPVNDISAGVQNMRALERAVHAIADDGAGVHLYPTGSTNRSSDWRRGIGHVVRKLVCTSNSASILLLPMVYDVRYIHLAGSALLPSASPLRPLAQASIWMRAGFPSVFAPPPTSIADLALDGTESSREITCQLSVLWQRARAMACTTFRDSPIQGELGARRQPWR